ncbi:HTTM domain-containing protein [Blastopirellula sp. JC732]|uniref:HTTM domain-containing protein n=1 Tax=Blastopirellula sediminis TaxID=2894196 RepID=A0A9X1SI55_9BACT|nr:HTTM domain-containing protein [Blastopirellula sediminis]MCC9605803.1 HTTM domain-containing protein [Blastopirellula sediminis]MCC9630897.1 HTTM domain-containing protein [Blastopirellula sediminis]
MANQIDGSSLAMFRIGFGLVIVWHILKYFKSPTGVTEIERVFASPLLHFTYPGFSWVQPWSEPWLTVHFAVVGVAAALVALGLFYRVAIVTLFFGYTYIFLLEATLYNNHYYLICLLAFLLCFMPANRCWSLDNLIAKRFRKIAFEPAEQTVAGKEIPFWPVFTLRFQMFIVYFFGGVAKFNNDWLTGEPLFGPGNILHDFINSTIGLPDAIRPIHLCLFLAWGGLVFDLSVSFLLLWRKTRLLGLFATIIFHVHNHFIFPIGIFPAMALSSTMIFFDPGWLRQLADWVRRPRWNLRQKTSEQHVSPSQNRPQIAWGLAIALAGFIAWQTSWPLRHLFVEGDANWTEEGQDFSWRMMLRAKAAGHLTCHVLDPELHTVNEQGRPAIKWEACPEGTPRAIHIAIDSHLFNWNHHPGLTITHEPIYGRRLIYNPGAFHKDQAEAVQVGREKIEQQWRKTFGRVPSIEQAITLEQATKLIRERFQAEVARMNLDQKTEAEFLNHLVELEKMAKSEAEPVAGQESRRVQLVNALEHLDQSPLVKIVRPVLGRLEPFLLQGAPSSGEPLLVISDPELTQSSAADAELDLLKLSSGDPYIVWTDFSRLRPYDWRRLPQSFVTFEDRNLKVVWNHFREIEPYQLEKVAVRPWMIHQYAQRVGGLWRAKTGRQAGVSVESYVMMNYTVPQMLLDPTVDLTSVKLNHFSHNSWILPRNHSRIGVADQPVESLRR